MPWWSIWQSYQTFLAPSVAFSDSFEVAGVSMDMLQFPVNLAPGSMASLLVLISPVKDEVAFIVSNSETVILPFTEPSTTVFLQVISPFMEPVSNNGCPWFLISVSSPSMQYHHW
jgi:hypothetical protein